MISIGHALPVRRHEVVQKKADDGDDQRPGERRDESIEAKPSPRAPVIRLVSSGCGPEGQGTKGRDTRAAFSPGQGLFVRRVVAVATSSQESLLNQLVMSDEAEIIRWHAMYRVTAMAQRPP